MMSLQAYSETRLLTTSQHVGSTHLHFAMVADATEQASQAPRTQPAAAL